LAVSVVVSNTGCRTGGKPEVTHSDVIIVGAGISGLAAAIEAASAGATVTVIDVWSVFGGHAVMSEGAVTMVDTPIQRAQGILDSPDIAYRDFLEYGEDADEHWVRLYVDRSRAELYDWLTALGVQFESVSLRHGNSVPRYHETRGRGLGLVSPIYLESLKFRSISFQWNMKAVRLLTDRERVVGVEVQDLRTGTHREFRARSTILATGGFQSNLQMVREHWPRELPVPPRILVGSGVNSVGAGHAMARGAGAALSRMDHQWNYPVGLPDPRFPGAGRGVNVRTGDAIWVNADAQRFVNEMVGSAYGSKVTLPAVLREPGATFWAILDDEARRRVAIAGTDWGDFAVIQRLVFDNRDLVKRGESIEALAQAAGLPPAALVETVRRYNAFVDAGEDRELGRFGRLTQGGPETRGIPKYSPRKIERSPFYSMQLFPLSRKSMGGVVIDTSCRVLDMRGGVIPGLYAVGELTGLAGINGKAGLEGTFLGPSILTGRVAGRAVRAEAPAASRSTAGPSSMILPAFTVPPGAAAAGCTACHDLGRLLAMPRPGYAHFERVHRVIRERAYECALCHQELAAEDAPHRIDRAAQVASCRLCHVGIQGGTAPRQ
jgi:predicted oxidoreductase